MPNKPDMHKEQTNPKQMTPMPSRDRAMETKTPAPPGKDANQERSSTPRRDTR